MKKALFISLLIFFQSTHCTGALIRKIFAATTAFVITLAGTEIATQKEIVHTKIYPMPPAHWTADNNRTVAPGEYSVWRTDDCQYDTYYHKRNCSACIYGRHDAPTNCKWRQVAWETHFNPGIVQKFLAEYSEIELKEYQKEIIEYFESSDNDE